MFLTLSCACAPGPGKLGDMPFAAPPASALPHVPSAAATVRQAHRFLLALAQGQNMDWRSVPRSALRWLEDRSLIEPCLGPGGWWDYRVTSKGIRAVLGRAAEA